YKSNYRNYRNSEIMRFFKSLYIHTWFFYGLLLLAACFVLSFFIKALFIPVAILFWVFLGGCFWDVIFLYASKGGVAIQRNYPEKLSNGDNNDLEIILTSHYPRRVRVRVLEEFPIQLQLRNVEFTLVLKGRKKQYVNYQVRPTARGIYTFGRCHVMVKYLGLFER